MSKSIHEQAVEVRDTLGWTEPADHTAAVHLHATVQLAAVVADLAADVESLRREIAELRAGARWGAS